MTLKEKLHSVDLKLRELLRSQEARSLAVTEPEQAQSDVLTPWRDTFTEEEKRAWRKESFRIAKKTLLQEVRDHAVPLTLLLTLLLIPKLQPLWAPTIIIWWVIEASYRRLSPANKLRVKGAFPESWFNSRVFREMSEGMKQVRPFVFVVFCMHWLTAIVWMAAHWLFRVINPKEKQISSEETIKFVQDRRPREEEEEANFIHSRAFSLTCLLLFGSGLPAAFTFFLYRHLGIDAIVGFPSHNPHFMTVFVIVNLYIASFSWCASVLFFKSWFTFPLNFAGNEEEIEMNKDRVVRHTRSWFTQALTMNSPGSGPSALAWSEIKALRLDQSKNSLYPLPKTAFPGNSLVYSFLNKLAQVVDGINGNGQDDECLYFTTAESVLPTSERVNSGRMLRVKLSDLTGDERAKLYYAVRKWAPHVVIDEAMQERIMGTTVLQAPRYTQMWYELLADKMPIRCATVLPPATTLENGDLTIKERLASGGQANVYLAQQADGTEVVLKEFILSTSDAVGALIESAGEFETEATLLSELDHPRIVKMLHLFAEGRRLYLVLEKVDGVSLRKIVKSRQSPLSEKETIDLALQVCDVLSYLHGQQPPVVHRDIAPDNLLLSQSSGIKVIDFSLAAEKKSRRTTTTMGKHSYAPPEQFEDQPCPQSDIYALGATMYFLLTGEDPKPITTSDVRSERSDISEKLDEIIKRATAFNLEDRYPSVDWLRLDLEAAALAAPRGRGRKRKRSNRSAN